MDTQPALIDLRGPACGSPLKADSACPGSARPRLVPAADAPEAWPARHRQIVRRLRAARRIAFVLLLTPAACVVQWLLLRLPGQGPRAPKVRFARFYWSMICRIIGLRVRVVGEPASGGGRPVVFAINHTSWLDIPAVGGILPGCFVSKDDVATWPAVGTVARLGRSVFVSRQRSATGRERADMRQRLADGDNLVLFPEGTSSDGSRVLPFRSSFFAVTDGDNPPLVQPASLVYDRLAGLPVGRASRSAFAWYGDMDLAPHVWRLVQWRGLRATLLLHAPLEPAAFEDRKALAAACHAAVAEGAASLRQNRPATVLPCPPACAPARVPSACPAASLPECALTTAFA